jgi:hypothetical protein
MENIFIMEGIIFTLYLRHPLFGLPIGYVCTTPRFLSGRSADTLDVRIIAWSVILCKKYLTSCNIRYRLVLPSLLANLLSLMPVPC